MEAQKLACPACNDFYHFDLVDYYLTNYFLYLLENPAVSGILLQAQWRDLSLEDPGSDPKNPAAGSLALNFVDDVLNAIDTWNKQNPTKTLQLLVTPGFNSPTWLFNAIDAAAGGPGEGSCDGLFTSPPSPVLSSCRYTKIFLETESGTPSHSPLPMPWDPTYKSKWQIFLEALNYHIMSRSDSSSLVSISVAGPTASSAEMILPNEKNNSDP